MAKEKLSPREEFDKALTEHAGAFGVSVGEDERARLCDYFEIVLRWNSRLHLVAPCAPTEFAVRHILESLVALRFFNEGASVVDVGSGAGLPVIPCLIVRADLSATLVESSSKKAVFLREALHEVGRTEAARVVAERFERVEPHASDFLTCRALERFTEVLPALVSWAAHVETLLLFGGEGLREKLVLEGLTFETIHIPESERRFLFVVRRMIET
jgi:16S rRNA (guanine527-N7)-methyltransferase